jgi:transcription antitermination factor NusG
MANYWTQLEIATELGVPPADYCVPKWYAAYTSANHEKTVASQLGMRGVDYFLPLYETVGRWKDRRVKLQRPLLPGYVFVHLALRERFRVLEVPGVAHLVSFGGHPAALPEQDIQAIQNVLSQGHRVEPHDYLQTGRRARVRCGPLQGLEGRILRRKNKTRFILSFDLIMRSMSVEIDETNLAPVNLCE